MLSGSIRSLSRLISMAEREDPEFVEVVKEISPMLGKSYVVGLTGPPGGGKSTLVDKLTAIARKKGLSVGIIAVDPTSPFTGGALLGDRIRMQQHYLDEGVFIRSMATRGSKGGLPRTTKRVIKLLDAFGKDLILVETVGTGQTEIDIIEAVDTILLVLVPEAGDAIQIMKAGLMEIADIFVINKADREGADRIILEIENMLILSPRSDGWVPPVVPTQAIKEIGVDRLYEEIEKHKNFLISTGKLDEKRRKQRREEFFQIIEASLKERLVKIETETPELSTILKDVEEGKIDPYTAAAEVLRNRDIVEKWLSKEIG